MAEIAVLPHARALQGLRRSVGIVGKARPMLVTGRRVL
jgi:hypothetical protein